MALSSCLFALAQSVAFVGVDVVPMDAERVVPDQTVIVRDGRIESIGPAAEARVPEGAIVVEGRGRWLMPGLADMHVHTWMVDELVLFVANGVTLVRNMFGSPMHVQLRDQIAAGERLGPTIVTAGPIVDGDPPVWPGSYVVTTPERAREVVAEHVALHYDFVKVYSRLPPAAYDAVIAAAREAKLPVDGHVPSAVGIEAALDAGQRSIEHLIGYESWLRRSDWPGPPEGSFRGQFEAWSHLDRERFAEVADITRASGAWNCPTLIVMQRWAHPGRDLPYLKYVPPFMQQMWRGMEDGRTDVALVVADGNPVRSELVGALHKGGARILLGTDQGNPWVAAGFSLHEELANLVAAGLSPYEALRAGTSAPAEFLGTPGAFGTVVVGARADLILLEANPLEDVANAKRRAGVMVRGRWMPESELATMLEELATRYAPPAEASPAAETPSDDERDG